MKHVYLVIGSEDGTILVTGSAERAAEVARDYVGFPPSNGAAADMAKNIRREGFDTIENPAQHCHANVERWVLN